MGCLLLRSRRPTFVSGARPARLRAIKHWAFALFNVIRGDVGRVSCCDYLHVGCSLVPRPASLQALPCGPLFISSTLTWFWGGGGGSNSLPGLPSCYLSLPAGTALLPCLPAKLSGPGRGGRATLLGGHRRDCCSTARIAGGPGARQGPKHRLSTGIW
jgi:hypothetical protein